MAGDSNNLFNPLIQQIFSMHKPKVIFDIGVGKGKVGQLCRKVLPRSNIQGFEVYAPYIENYKENLKAYDKIICADFRQWITVNSAWKADIIVFGDVLEHFFYSEVHDTIQFCLYRTKYILIVWPTDYPQDSFDDNSEEAHRSNFTFKDLAIYPVELYQKISIANRPSHMNLILIQGFLK